MLDYSESPPPLHHSPATSDKVGAISRESTPHTPVGFAPSAARKPDKVGRAKDGQLPWFRKPIDVGIATTSLFVDSPLLEPDFDDHSFPLFGASPPASSMAGAGAPLDMASRQASSSPRGPQSSNLTSALLRNSDAEARRPRRDSVDDRNENIDVARSVSMADGASWDCGARPILMRGISGDKARRGSTAPSMNGGMSWGAISVGSWIRDDIMMSGTSPFTIGNSPSYHSSSYLPKLEANFMRDFSCCGLTLPTLHDLLQHYEEAHAQKPSQPTTSTAADQPPMPDTRAALATNAAATVQQQVQQQRQQQQQQQQGQGVSKPGAPAQSSTRFGQFQTHSHKPTAFSSNLQTIPDMDALDDMEMEDVDGLGESTPPSNPYPQPSSSPNPPPAEFNKPPQPRVPNLNMNLMQGHQGLRNSTPTTPVASGRQGLPFQNNPTVSSVNTPTLMSNPMHQQVAEPPAQYRSTPDSSLPGTPVELDESVMAGMGDMTMQNSQMFASNQNQSFDLDGFAMNNDMLDLCIDEPAKRLFSPTGGYGSQNQQFAHMKLGSGQYGPDSDIARRIREQQLRAGVPDTTAGMMPNDEPKPFRCPVIGCEKAYKNQNGLKYHKSHGHNNQRLHDNADGTFSIVNPETSVPYEGTLGMEKEKPYKCETCGKRYKNLNGLKYHKSHSPPCNPELQNPSSHGVTIGLLPNYKPSIDTTSGSRLCGEMSAL